MRTVCRWHWLKWVAWIRDRRVLEMPRQWTLLHSLLDLWRTICPGTMLVLLSRHSPLLPRVPQSPDLIRPRKPWRCRP